ncbi:MFS general substrate transporter [Mytilinidion resinicola]|uniref:MFS general substrate transporter n=1 Tax=Mytilinidion resinicola TaxID=574789 RepID=A0A6A6Y886_9PEZI|nr:MFS general substrate transporter [Mytilinidion resinicola]KAF2804819.1 MFS general substrate transporter [Mytilinidion resinicola]
MSESRDSEWESVIDSTSPPESKLDRDGFQLQRPRTMSQASTVVEFPQTRFCGTSIQASAPPPRLGSFGFELEKASTAISTGEIDGLELQTFITTSQYQAPSIPAFPATPRRQTVLEAPAVRAAALKRRFDLRIMPFLVLLFALFYLSCGNIVNPWIHRIGQDLHISQHEVMMQWLMFYIAYILIGIPSSLCLESVLDTRAWFSLVFGSAGLIIFATAFAESLHSLRTLRFLLGLCGGQALPGIFIFLGRFYSKPELYVRFGLCVFVGTFFGTLSGIFGDSLERVSRWNGSITQHVLISNVYALEGYFVAILGYAAMFLIPMSPSIPRASLWKTLCCSGAFDDADNTLRDSSRHQDTPFSLRCLANKHTALCASALFHVNSILQSIPTFTPQIVAQMGHTGTRAQIISAVPLAVSSITGIIFTVLCARKDPLLTGHICAILATISIFGASNLLWGTTPAFQYVAVILLAIGILPALPALLVCGVNHAKSPRDRALVAGFLSSVGALGGFCGGFMGLEHSVRSSSETGIWVGHIINLIAAISIVASGFAGMLMSGRAGDENIQD